MAGNDYKDGRGGDVPGSPRLLRCAYSQLYSAQVKETSPGESPSPQLRNHAHAHCPDTGVPVLLLETDAGLVLVDTGFGLEDIAGLARRLGWFRHVIRPVFSAEETPARQAGRLGFTQDDVRHIIITHFDMDHIGALADFPRAAVHATAAEARGATRPGSWLERQRYRFPQLAHGPKIVEHNPDGEMWRGFAAAREPAHIIHRGWPGSCGWHAGRVRQPQDAAGPGAGR